MRIINLSIILTGFVLVSACASWDKENLDLKNWNIYHKAKVKVDDIKVDIQVDPKAELSDYKTYTWLGAASMFNDPEKRWQAPKMDIAGYLKYLIGGELRRYGIIETTETPDVSVGFFMGVDMETMALQEDPNDQVDVLKNVPKAGLIVVLTDVETGFVVWRGIAEGELHEKISDDMVRTRLEYAVSTMFKLLPAK